VISAVKVPVAESIHGVIVNVHQVGVDGPFFESVLLLTIHPFHFTPTL
jgi:hypothetical protein